LYHSSPQSQKWENQEYNIGTSSTTPIGFEQKEGRGGNKAAGEGGRELQHCAMAKFKAQEKIPTS